MAKHVQLKKGKEFTFRTGGSTASKYPWDEWFNGDLLLLEKGTDYAVNTDAMGPKIKTAARRRYKIVQVSKRDADNNKLEDSLIIKGRDMMADERQAEDLRRAEDKAARASGLAEPTEAQEEAAA